MADNMVLNIHVESLQSLDMIHDSPSAEFTQWVT